MSAERWTAGVFSVVYEGALTEDGERRDECAFYVVCEDIDGRRYASLTSHTTEQCGCGEAMRRAEAQCDRVQRFLDRGRTPVGSPKWTRIAGAYGSAAWSEREALLEEGRALEAEGFSEEAKRFHREHGV